MTVVGHNGRRFVLPVGRSRRVQERRVGDTSDKDINLDENHANKLLAAPAGVAWRGGAGRGVVAEVPAGLGWSVGAAPCLPSVTQGQVVSLVVEPGPAWGAEAMGRGAWGSVGGRRRGQKRRH